MAVEIGLHVDVEHPVYRQQRDGLGARAIADRPALAIGVDVKLRSDRLRYRRATP